MTLESGQQILKTRDDHAPVSFGHDQAESDTKRWFRIAAEADCSWAKSDDPFGPEKLRPRIEPWLTALAQSEHLSLMIGSGLTHAVHGLATDEGLPGMAPIAFENLSDEITNEARRIAKTARRENGNFEDQIRVANELLRGLEILAPTKQRGSGAKQVTALRRA